MKGLGPETVDRIDQQRKHGVPADDVSLVGGRRTGGGRRPSHLYLDLGADLFAQLAEIAEHYGQTNEEAAVEFIQNGVAQWLPLVEQSA